MNFKFSKKTICIFVLLMVFISLGTVSAMEVNSTDDNMNSPHDQLELENDDEKLSILNDENYLSSAETFNGTTFSELRTKINSLNNGDVLDLTSNVTQDGNSEITISKSITVNGNGITIDANGKSRIFNINSGATVVLNNITFTNGYHSAKGGAIYNDNSKVTITASQFIKNSAADDGGAVYISNALSNSIINSTFINNSANNGGAIYFNGEVSNVTIDGSFKDNNAVRAGGAVYVRGQSSNNTFSAEFDGNQATQASGGAIFFYSLSQSNSFESVYRNNYALYGGAVFFYNKANDNKFNSEFISNIAKSCGGAIFFHNTTNNNSFAGEFINNNALGEVDETNGNGGAITFKDVSTNCTFTCDFINNTAAKNGGGVNYRQTPHNITFNGNFINNTSPNGGGVNFFERFENIIFNGEFIGNSATYGGAIAADGGIIKDVSFKDNRAKHGGAVYFIGSGEIINCNFINNTASEYGGAVEFLEYSIVTNCSFTNNKASYGGAIDFERNGSVTNCNFINNKASGKGGAVYFYDNYGDVTNCTFINNTAGTDGGAINLVDGGIVSDCNFTNNTASSLGGAINFEYEGDVTNCTFTNNAAGIDGGALYFDHESDVTNCTFTNNTADSDGGAIFFSLDGDVTKCTFTDNTAAGCGGAVYFETTGTVTNSNFTSNTANSYGGAVYFYDNYGDVTNCTFINNTANNGGAISFYNEGTATNCNFTNNTANINGGAIAFNSNNAGEIITCNFINNTASSLGGAVFYYLQGDVTDCTFTNNIAYDGGAVYTYYGNVINCNFTGNEAGNVGGAVRTTSSHVENCNFDDNAAYEGGAFYFLLTGVVTNCNFTNNTAYDASAILLDSGDITNCTFTDNAALNNGGAVLFDYDGNIINSSFTGNNATKGSAVFFRNYKTDEKTISNSYFLNNKANADDNAPLQVTLNGNNIEITFFGQDNILNAIYSPDYITITNVTYWGAEGIDNTDNYYYYELSNREAGQNITITGLVNGKILNTTKTTDADGKIVLENVSGDYWISVRHDEDSYYTEAETVFTNIELYANITSVETNNKTVNLTAKSNIFNEYMPGQLIFLLPDGTELNATYDSNRTWWAVHTFDDYTEYNVSGSYIGLSNVTVNNATVNITKADSAIMPIKDFASYYNESIEVNVATEGAAGITAWINGEEVSVINNYTILIPGLSIGNYTLTVTTVPDEDHNPVTVTAEITVGKAPTRITLIDELLNLYVKDTVSDFAALTPGDAGTLNYTSSNEYVAKIENGSIIAVGAGRAKITVSFAGNDNYTAAENKSLYVIVKPLESSISVNKTEFELVIGDEADIIANADPTDLVIDYATDDTNIVSVDENGHITALGNGTAFIFVSVGDNYQYDFAYVGVIVTVKKTTEMDVNVSADGNDVTITAAVDSSASGLVKFNINGKAVYVDVNEGKAVYDLTLTEGNYTVEATYMGDANFNSTSTSKSFIISKKTAIISANNLVMDYKDGSSWTVNLTDDKGNAIGNAVIEIGIDGKDYIVKTDENGIASLAIDLAAGTYKVNASFSGDSYADAFAEATIKVSKINPEISVFAADAEYGDDLVVNVTLSGDVSRRAVVTVDNETKYVSLTDGKGSVKFTGLAVGKHTIVASYNGDVNFIKSSVNATVNVVRAKTEIDVFAVVSDGEIIVNVILPSDVSRRAIVTIGEETKLVSLTNGKATVKFTGLGAGSFTIVASYNGDVNYDKGSASTNIVVAKAASDIKVTSNPVAYGEDVVVEVVLPGDVSRRAVVTLGNETKYVSLVNGIGSVKFSGLPIGSYNVVASYNGDENYINSSATVVAKVIKAVPEIQVSTSDISVGEALDVDVQLPSDVTRRATVTIGNESQFVSLKDGIGSVKFTGLEAGAHEVVVSYAGDTNYKASSYTTVINVKD